MELENKTEQEAKDVVAGEKILGEEIGPFCYPFRANPTTGAFQDFLWWLISDLGPSLDRKSRDVIRAQWDLALHLSRSIEVYGTRRRVHYFGPGRPRPRTSAGTPSSPTRAVSTALTSIRCRRKRRTTTTRAYTMPTRCGPCTWTTSPGSSSTSSPLPSRISADTGPPAARNWGKSQVCPGPWPPVQLLTELPMRSR